MKAVVDRRVAPWTDHPKSFLRAKLAYDYYVYVGRDENLAERVKDRLKQLGYEEIVEWQQSPD
jgi:hypothetical protein